MADLQAALRAGGLEPQQVHVERSVDERTVTAEHLARWFEADTVDDTRPSYSARLQAGGITDKELQAIAAHYRQQLQGTAVAWESATAYVVAVPAAP